MDGLIRIDKPAGWTSHDAVSYVKRALGVKKAGHTGTLDPAATGLLIVLVGRATRLARYYEHDVKRYLSVLRLGTETDTQDAEGETLRRCPVPDLSETSVKAVLDRFNGEIAQLPPMYSAVKVDGRPLYAHARAGREVEREARNVTVHELRLAALDGDRISLVTVCSKGTYIRTLCRDIAEALGSCGHMESLRRTDAGGYGVEGAVELGTRPCKEELLSALTPMGRMLDFMPAAAVMQGARAGVLNGRAPSVSDMERVEGTVKPGAPCRLLGTDGGLLAVARPFEDEAGSLVFGLEVVLS